MEMTVSALPSRYRTGSVIICFSSSSSKGWGRMPDSRAGKGGVGVGVGGGEDAEPTDREIVLKTGLTRKMKAKTQRRSRKERRRHTSHSEKKIKLRAIFHIQSSCLSVPTSSVEGGGALSRRKRSNWERRGNKSRREKKSGKAGAMG